MADFVHRSIASKQDFPNCIVRVSTHFPNRPSRQHFPNLRLLLLRWISMRRIAKAVLGLSFHPTHPFILLGLESGEIEIWNYRRNAQVKVFKEHSGAVRSVNFHPSLTKPYFVSGGDDTEIKLWMYDTGIKFQMYDTKNNTGIKLEMYDANIKRRMYVAYGCLFTLSGHKGSIMTVQFHHTSPWIISASEDTTVRIWNWESQRCIAVLKGHYKSVRCAEFYPLKEDQLKKNPLEKNPLKNLVVSASWDKTVRVWDVDALEEGSADVTISLSHKNTLDHSGRVNWASWHPTLPGIVSSDDIGDVKIWRMDDKGICIKLIKRVPRLGSVSRALFSEHSEQESIVILEDKSIRVFDGSLRTIKTREHDRFLSLSAHSRTNLFAAGHGSGIDVFKLERQRPTISVSGDKMLLLRNGYLWGCKFSTPEFIEFILIRTKGDGGSAVFVSPIEFAVLEKHTNRVLLKDLENKTRNLVIFDLEKTLGELETSSTIRYVVWSQDWKSVALLSKHSIIIADKKLVPSCTVYEAIRVKSGAWSDQGVFIYSTLTHLNYCLPNGETSILLTLDAPVYVVKVCGDKVSVIKRDGTIHDLTIDCMEYAFISRLPNPYRPTISEKVMLMKSVAEIRDQSITDYLQKKGFADVALHFETDERKRLSLALSIGNIPAAIAYAGKINEKYYWSSLGEGALLWGKTSVAEYVYQKAMNFERLSFLYLITGRLEKVREMMKVVEARNDVSGQFQAALYLGVKIMEYANHLPLAYLAANTRGLDEVAKRIEAEL